jgi:hypothetical protein
MRTFDMEPPGLIASIGARAKGAAIPYRGLPDRSKAMPLKYPADAIIVQSLSGEHAALTVTCATPPPALAVLGFALDGDRYVRRIASEQERRILARELAAMGALFAVGPGWPPADLAAMYRDEGEAIGPIHAIAWTSPDTFYIDVR